MSFENKRTMLCNVKAVCEESNEVAKNVKKILFSNRSISKIEDLRECSSLEKVDLSKNQVADATNLSRCTSITWLNLAHNNLESMEFVAVMKRLTVLNLGYNSISDIVALAELRSLKALILNNNMIKRAAGLERLVNLNTLVLSHNQLEEIEVSSLSSLVKLQLSHNRLKSFPDVRFNLELKSVLLNDNSITCIPDDSVGSNNRLEIVEVGNNSLKKLKHIKALSSMKSIVRLNLLGNDLCNIANFASEVRAMFPTVSFLNSQPISRFVQSSKEVGKSGKSGGQQASEKKRKRSKSEDDVNDADDVTGGQDFRQKVEKKRSKKRVAFNAEASSQSAQLSASNDDAKNPTVAEKHRKERHKDAEKHQKKRHKVEGKQVDDELPTSSVYSSNSSSELANDDMMDKSVKKHKKRIGVPALSDKNSGVVKIVDSGHQKRKHLKQSAGLDIFDIPDVGSGVQCFW